MQKIIIMTLINKNKYIINKNNDKSNIIPIKQKFRNRILNLSSSDRENWKNDKIIKFKFLDTNQLSEKAKIISKITTI